MKYIRKIYNKIKENWFLILLLGWVCLYMWASTKKIEQVTSMEKYESGKAIYMPGASCTIRATSDIDESLFVELAMACAKRHGKYLNSLSKE